VKRAVCTLAELGDDLVLAPERHLVTRLARASHGASDSIALGDLVIERRERLETRDIPRALVLDTTHARDGVLDIGGAPANGEAPKSSKKLVRAGDVIVSRLRPYLRQIALVHPQAMALSGRELLAVSTEFYVLSARAEADIAFLLPFLLGEEAQAVLAASQEGGHHPRVPRASLFALRVPRAFVEGRKARSRAVLGALDAVYRANDAWRAVRSLRLP
jgi:hypothetical protein